MKHQPRKRFGQNFLQNQLIIDAILNGFHLQKNDKVIEIGPGMGALTKPLLRHLNHLVAIEIDRDLCGYLGSLPAAESKLTLLSKDALDIDYSQWGGNLRIVGNLPYNISTPLLLHLLNYLDFIEDMHFMLQKEVVLRLIAQSGSKAYGRLSVMIQYQCEAELLMDVMPDAFYPKPKVDSAIVRLTPRHSQPLLVTSKQLEAVVAKAFAMRRKTLANNLKPLLNAEQLLALNIDPGARPEQITIEQYVTIAKYLNN